MAGLWAVGKHARILTVPIDAAARYPVHGTAVLSERVAQRDMLRFSCWFRSSRPGPDSGGVERV